MERPFLIAISYPVYINKMASQLHSPDNFSAMEAQVHLKLAKRSKETCEHLNLEESPNSKKCANLRFLLATLTYIIYIHIYKRGTTTHHDYLPRLSAQQKLHCVHVKLTHPLPTAVPSCVVTVTVYADWAAESAVSVSTAVPTSSLTLYTTGSN